MGCIRSKPKVKEDVPEKVKCHEIIRRESQKPWNRASAQVYCGDPKKDNQDPDKTTDETEKSETTNIDASKADSSDVKQTEAVLGENNNASSIQESIPVVENECNTEVEAKNCDISPDQKNEGGKPPSPPRIIDHFKESDIVLKLSPPPLIAPFDPSARIVKRPRSLDAVENFGKRPVNKTRPLSYSPGLRMKTKHPRCLHSIEEIPKFRERPKSIDFSLFFQDKDSDKNIQKLKRLLTQKSPRKSKTQEDHCILDRLILQPNQVKCIEEGPSRCFQPSQMLARRRKNRDFKVREVEYLRRAAARPRMKFSKSLDIFFHRSEQHLEYDPFLDPLAAQPSNPWTSDDTTFWDINKQLVEIPTVMRVKKWALSFEDLLSDETGLTEFEHFLKKEYSHENIHFYKACKDLVVAPLSKAPSLKSNIESKFLTHGALSEVNVDARTMEKVREWENSQKDVNRFMYQPAMEHVYALMKKDSYHRFIRSEEYKELMQNAQVHYTKRRGNLFWGGSNKKKSPSPQPSRHRRGSSGSDNIPNDTEIGGVSYHSYSTGNLRELDDKPKRSFRTSNSPSLRRRTDEESKKVDSDLRRRSNLDVPRVHGSSTQQDAARKSEAMAQCLALNVPGKTNIVAPWDGRDAV